MAGGRVATALIALLLAALLPAIPLRFVGGEPIRRARGLLWLGVLTAGIVVLAQHEVWLSLIGLWFLVRWPRHPEPWRLLPSLVMWGCVGALWFLVRSVPRASLELVPWVWLAIGVWQVGMVAWRRDRHGGRQRGTFGSPVLTALYGAILAPFCPVWLWPVLALGMALICSWLAVAGLTAGLLWSRPDLWVVPVLILWLALVSAWLWSPVVRGHRLLEWTLRGDSLDSIYARLRVWPLVWREVSWTGQGPGTMEQALMRWGSRHRCELPYGEAHMEVAHMTYEYGVLGLVAILAFVWRVAPGLTADAWSAAWITGATLSLLHWPWRHPALGPMLLVISARVAS